MTENEAIKEIKRWTEILLRAGSRCTTETAEAQDMAIKALEEVQQYRETGHTPAMVRDLIRGYKTEHAQNMKLVNELEDYQQIGTPEELRVLKDKQVAKKVSLRRVRKVDGFDIGECPTCGEDVSRDCDGTDIFCPYCGQKLNWEDEE